EGNLSGLSLEWKQGFAVTVSLVSDKYLNSGSRSMVVEGVEEAEQMSGVTIFHGATIQRDGILYTKEGGGRILHVTAEGETLQVARARTYEAVQKIFFLGMCYRKDIAEVV
ncbi:MAG: phosphoribosylamine/glycine ligase, partial [Parcubacteria group bacterium Gr01-1014_66]